MSAELPVKGSVAMPSRRRCARRPAGGIGRGVGGLFRHLHFPRCRRRRRRRRRRPGRRCRRRRLGTGQVRVALILPLSAGGNAGVAGQAMRNAAEMALAEFNAPNIQLLVKDDGGSADGARLAAQQALDEGAEIILGPLFAQSVSIVGQIARSRNVPVIAFSTDANVATRGVYLLSFLPESDVGAHRAIRRLGREALLRGAHSRQSLWHGGGSGVQTGRRPSRRPNRRARALSA